MINYECCKMKQLTSYLCINCFKVFHKSCIHKNKSKYIFVGDHKIKCCKAMNSVEDITHEKSLLEETISEINENSLLQEQYISRLKEEHKKFVEEVSIREEELNLFIKNQEDLLKTANIEIGKLKNEIFLLTKKETISQSTQTRVTEKRMKQTLTQFDNTSYISLDIPPVSNQNAKKKLIVILILSSDVSE